MAVLRKIKKSNYTVIDNNIFKNKDLSLKGKGLLCSMLSLPDDWQFTEVGLAELFNESRDTIRKAIKELETLGYLTRERARDNKGFLKETVYTIYEEPMLENPMLENPMLENPMLDNRHNKIINILNTNNINNNNISIYDLLQENGFNLTPLQYDLVADWEDNDLTKYAIKKAVLNNKFNVGYIDKILYSYKKNHITTVEQAIEYDEAYNNKRDSYYKNKYESKESRYERERRLLQVDDEE